MVELGRRGFVAGLVGLLAAPAIVRASSLDLPPVRRLLLPEPAWALGDVLTFGSTEQVGSLNWFVVVENADPTVGSNTILTTQMITRETMRSMHTSNQLLANMEQQWPKVFGRPTTWRIRLPNDFTVHQGPKPTPNFKSWSRRHA